MASSSHLNNDSIPVEKISDLNLDYSDIELDYHGDKDVADPGEKIANPPWCMVGHVVTDKFVNPNSLSDAMGKAWRPREGMIVKELGNNVFVFQFFNQREHDRITEDGPWNFMQNPVLLRPLNPDQNPWQVELISLDILVQIHDLVGGRRSERILRDIGNTIGSFKYNNTKNQDMLWKDYMRI
ncbi:hypothetical protein KY285_010356 [Solanum tuberosum]|nr:hypothetical protein KY285_010356 [Solanum tuberosum]